MNKETNHDSIQEMEQIQRGLEEFLRQELKDMESGDGQGETHREPQFFTIGEEEEQEKEIDIIGTQRRAGSSRTRRYDEDYVEDWDSADYRRRVRETEEDDYGHRRSESQSRNRSRSSQGQQSRQEQGSSGRGQQSQNRREQGSSGRGQQSQDRQSQGSASQGRKSRSMQNRSRGRDNREDQDDREYAKGSTRGSGRKKKKRKSRFKRFLITVAVIVALLGVGLYYLVGVVYGKMNYSEIDSVAKESMKEDGVVNILLIGNDSRENGEDGRSDAMILVSISSKTKTIYMTSLLRDMYVEIPGHDGNRLNAAYAFGGAELLMDTIEQNLDIKVNRYVLVNFEAFANLVDAVDGVDLELTSEEIEYVNGYLVEYNMLTNRPQGTDNMDTSVSGLVHLNGPQALAYSRNRYLGTDFGRTERQRKVLSAVITKLPKAVVTNPGELTEGLMPNLTTNLTQTECFRLSLMANKLITYDIVQSSIPIEGSYQNATIRKMAVLQVDFEANKKYLRENIYGEGAQNKE